MQYKYCQNKNFEDFSSGRVIVQKKGLTNFPVRLAIEIYCRCLSYLKHKTDICIYDPCCGGGYLLTAIGFLNSASIKTIIGSDFSNEALQIAKSNLELLTATGLKKRLSQLEDLYAQFNKESHLQAIESAKSLLSLVSENEKAFDMYFFEADILRKDILKIRDFKADIVMMDIPYGNMVLWQGNEDNMTSNLLDNLMPVLKPESIVAICSDKHQRVSSSKFRRLEKQQVGKRKFEIFSILNNMKV